MKPMWRPCLQTHFVGMLLLPLCFGLAWAVPPGFNVQGRLTDSNGVNRNGVYSIRFTIFDAATGGNVVWVKTFASISVVNGNFQTVLGDPSDTPSQTIPAAFAGDSRYLEIDVLSGPSISGPEAPLVPRQQLVSVPFALRSQSSDYVPVGTILDWLRPNATTPPPTGFIVCDPTLAQTGVTGGVISDSNSPFNGATVPDLRDKFTYGVPATRIGEQAGNNSLNLSHTHTFATGGAASNLFNAACFDDGSQDTAGRFVYLQSPSGEGECVADHTHNGTSNAGLGPTDIRPAYFGVLKIMRFK